MIWSIVIGVIGFCTGWGMCAMFASGKIADLELELRIETQNKEHWKKKTWELIGKEIANTKNEKIENLKEEQE